jgi:hypothetical protein
MRRTTLALILSLTLAGCSQLSELFSAHADVAAEAAGTKLSTDSLATLLLEAKGARLSPETAEFLANLWIDYQLFGHATVNGILTTDSAVVAAVMWPEIAESIGTRWHDTLMARRTSFTESAFDSAYASTDSSAVRVIQHLLVRVAPNAPAAERATAQRNAQGYLARIRGGANFAAIARQYSDDQASKATGGVMNAAPRGAYVTPFDSAAWTLAPGQVSGLVVTPFGFHILRRPPIAESRAEIQNYLEFMAGRAIDSMYMDSLATARDLDVKDNAASVLRTVLSDPQGNRESGKTLATFDGGKLTVREALRWTGAMGDQATTQLRSATDTQLTSFVRALAQNIMLIEVAKGNGIGLTPVEFAALSQTYSGALDTLRLVLGLTPDVVDPSASEADRTRAANAQVSIYVGRLLRREAPPRIIPGPMVAYLRDRVPYRVNAAGIARATEMAAARRDSAQAVEPGPAMPAPPASVPQVTPGGGR